MNLRQTTKRIIYFVLLPLFVAVVAGYTVENIKGTPPGEIAAALWHPFGATIDGTSAWLREPAQLTHLNIVFLLAVFAWLLWFLFGLRRRLIRLSNGVHFSSLGVLTDEVTHLQQLRRTVAEGRPAGEGRPADEVAKGFEPNRIQQIAARVLIDRYPKRLQLPDLAAAMQAMAMGIVSMPVAPQGEIARQMEVMEENGVATIDDRNSVMAYYGLTRHGRDFMLENLQASRIAQPNVDPRRSPLRTPP